MPTVIDRLIAEYTVLQLKIEATEKLKAQYTSNLREQAKYYEERRPHWAKGYTSDSVAAQAHLDCTVAMWELLGADNQTQAMATLGSLIRLRDSLADPLDT